MSLGSAGSALSEPKYSQLLSSCSCVKTAEQLWGAARLQQSGHTCQWKGSCPWWMKLIPHLPTCLKYAGLLISSTIHIYTEQTISFPTVTVINWITFHCNSVINLHSCLWGFQLPLALSCREDKWGFSSACFPLSQQRPDMDSASQRSLYPWHMWVHWEGKVL